MPTSTINLFVTNPDSWERPMKHPSRRADWLCDAPHGSVPTYTGVTFASMKVNIAEELADFWTLSSSIRHGLAAGRSSSTCTPRAWTSRPLTLPSLRTGHIVMPFRRNFRPNTWVCPITRPASGRQKCPGRLRAAAPSPKSNGALPVSCATATATCSPKTASMVFSTESTGQHPPWRLLLGRYVFRRHATAAAPAAFAAASARRFLTPCPSGGAGVTVCPAVGDNGYADAAFRRARLLFRKNSVTSSRRVRHLALPPP